MASVKSRINIEVTEQDIERAKKNDSYSCVVAQAVARTIPEATRLDVDVQSIRFSLPGERWTFLTPYAVQGYIVAFDAGDPIEPFSFQLRDPKKVARKGVLTPEGRIVHRARGKVDKLKKKVASGQEKLPELTEAEAELEAVKAAYKGAVKSKSDSGGRTPPPRVFKKKTRTYGHRNLRINK